ncbi:amidohydrolase family protein [Dokdonia sp. Hel_I_53]|uniref:amidohydrolase family protein n=1 Tax=Dokdonia sp. Hel_I_53 TaxID=1566287 RepID=UPI00119AD06C|nr:amidohydrolase family protein [Dokdonia sp. Hel_I_53]TVZ51047.1 imidazolonepropionase-like amidohydrolase [Dokdonia sp. Hel_I_53]
MKALYRILVAVVFIFGTTAYGQQTPADTQATAYTITGATAHLGNGDVIKNATIIFENGKITSVESNSTATKGEVINAQGKHVYPGFIATNTTLGLVEVGAVRQSNDDDEIGDFIPHVRGIIAYNAESKVVESMRPNGVLLAQIRPVGGMISGSSSVVQLDAWNWEDAAYKTDEGIFLDWPNTMTRGRWWLGEEPGFKPSKKYAEEVQTVKNFFSNAKAYQGGSRITNLPYQAMKGVFDGTQKVYISANDQRQILDVIAFAKAYDLKNIVLVGGYQAYKVASELVAANIPVILQRVQGLPSMEDHDYDLPYRMPKLLMDAGVTVALGYDAEYWQVRNLPFYAGQVTQFGMSDEDALKMITENPAKIMGISNTTGTLEVGKDATLFISDGNALDMRTNQLSRAFIQGRDISLESHQTRLWKRYAEKYNND